MPTDFSAASSSRNPSKQGLSSLSRHSPNGNASIAAWLIASRTFGLYAAFQPLVLMFWRVSKSNIHACVNTAWNLTFRPWHHHNNNQYTTVRSSREQEVPLWFFTGKCYTVFKDLIHSCFIFCGSYGIDHTGHRKRGQDIWYSGYARGDRWRKDQACIGKGWGNIWQRKVWIY